MDYWHRDISFQSPFRIWPDLVQDSSGQVFFVVKFHFDFVLTTASYIIHEKCVHSKSQDKNGVRPEMLQYDVS